MKPSQQTVSVTQESNARDMYQKHSYSLSTSGGFKSDEEADESNTVIVWPPAATVPGSEIIPYGLSIHPHTWICQAIDEPWQVGERLAVRYNEQGLPPVWHAAMCRALVKCHQ